MKENELATNPGDPKKRRTTIQKGYVSEVLHVASNMWILGNSLSTVFRGRLKFDWWAKTSGSDYGCWWLLSKEFVALQFLVNFVRSFSTGGVIS